MAFPGVEKLLDFSQALDVPMLDQVISAFYTAADPTMVRLAPRARRANRPPSGTPRIVPPLTPPPRATSSGPPSAPRAEIAKTPGRAFFFPSLPSAIRETKC